MPEIEFHQLQRPYKELRITTVASRRRMLSSLAIDGQQTPASVPVGPFRGYRWASRDLMELG